MKRLRDIGGQAPLFRTEEHVVADDQQRVAGRLVKSRHGMHYVPGDIINLPPDTYMGSACARCGHAANAHRIGNSCESFWTYEMLKRFGDGEPLAPTRVNERPWNVKMCYVCARMRDDVVFCESAATRNDLRTGETIEFVRYFHLCGPCRSGKEGIRESAGRNNAQ